MTDREKLIELLRELAVYSPLETVAGIANHLGADMRGGTRNG